MKTLEDVWAWQQKKDANCQVQMVFFFTNLVQKLIEASCFAESLLNETNRRFSECGICIQDNVLANVLRT